MLSIIIFLILCGLIWEFFDRIKSLPKQIRKDIEESFYPEAYLRNEERISATDAIEFDVFRDFYRNLEHKEKHIQSYAEYNGKKVCIVFYDWRQNPLQRLADYFFKMENI